MTNHILAIDQAPPPRAPSCFVPTAPSRPSRRGIPALSGLRLGRARSRGFVAQRARDLPRGHRRGGPHGARYCGRGHRQSARDDPRMGPGHRAADPQCDRVAGPADGRHMPEAEGRRRRGAGRAVLRPAARSVFLASKIAWLLNMSRRTGEAPSAAGSPSGPWICPAVAADRRRRARDRCDVPPAQRSTIFTPMPGAATCVRCSTCRAKSSPRCATHRRIRRDGAELFGAAIPILGIAGDQQAALIGQACFTPGMMKATYGTGCFAILNTGKIAVASRNRLITTIAYRPGGETVYGLEGAIFCRRGRAMAARRPAHRAVGRRDRGDGRGCRSGPGGRTGARLRRSRCTPLGRRARGALFGLTRGTDPTSSRARRSKASVSRPSTWWRPCNPIAAT